MFASLEHISSPGRALSIDDVNKLTGDVVVEAPPGAVKALGAALDARVIVVGTATSAPIDAPQATIAGSILTRVPASDVEAVARRDGVLAVLAEDRVLAAPSVADIAAALDARWLAGSEERTGIGRVMIGTVSSDAASPYFGQRERTCIVTRFDKTDIQLAALGTDLECLVLTGGGEPSPYLLDRVRSDREDIAVLLSPSNTVESVRTVEGLYGASRFDGAWKLARAVELLDEARVPTTF
jgi:hypothetical protein